MTAASRPLSVMLTLISPYNPGRVPCETACACVCAREQVGALVMSHSCAARVAPVWPLGFGFFFFKGKALKHYTVPTVAGLSCARTQTHTQSRASGNTAREITLQADLPPSCSLTLKSLFTLLSLFIPPPTQPRTPRTPPNFSAFNKHLDLNQMLLM